MKRKLLDSLLAGVEDTVFDTSFITADNYETVHKDLTDSLGGLLANAGIAIAEQKKLLQSAKSPEALQAAVKVLAVTAGNLMSASTRMLGWMGKQLPKRDSIDEVESNDGELFNALKTITGGVTGGVSGLLKGALPRRDSDVDYSKVSKDGSAVVSRVTHDGASHSILYRDSENDFIVAFDYDLSTGEYRDGGVSHKTFASADSVLQSLFGGK